MDNTEKVYLIKWDGPFSYNELCNWEKNWLEDNNETFNLYLLQGKKNGLGIIHIIVGKQRRKEYIKD